MAFVRPSAKTTRKGKDIIKVLEKAGHRLDGAHVTVGVHSTAGDYEGTDVSVAQVAFFSEFGTRDIPERSFLRSTVYENESLIKSWRSEALRNIEEKGWPVEKALEMIGLRVQLLIQNKIRNGIAPANSERTLERKKALAQGETPLIASGKLLRSLTYLVYVPGTQDHGAKEGG